MMLDAVRTSERSEAVRVAVAVDGGPGPHVRVAQDLAVELGLPMDHGDGRQFDFCLTVTPERLDLRQQGADAPGPVFADFLGRAAGGYRRRLGGRRQPLAAAVGLREGVPSVVDATAGLGRDAFRLACWGCRVTAVERSHIIAALLRDGLTRAMTVPQLDDIIGSRLELLIADGRSALSHMNSDRAPDVVYLDPMFPPAERASALAKKEMRVFRALVGDGDAAELFQIARQSARKRVVVKRLPHASPLVDQVDVSYRGKIARYDVYFT